MPVGRRCPGGNWTPCGSPGMFLAAGGPVKSPVVLQWAGVHPDISNISGHKLPPQIPGTVLEAESLGGAQVVRLGLTHCHRVPGRSRELGVGKVPIPSDSSCPLLSP